MTTHLHLMERLRISEPIPLLPLYAFPVWTATTLPGWVNQKHCEISNTFLNSVPHTHTHKKNILIHVLDAYAIKNMGGQRTAASIPYFDITRRCVVSCTSLFFHRRTELFRPRRKDDPKQKNGKGKGKAHPRTGHEGPKLEQRYSSTISLTSALDRGGWSMPHPVHFTPQ